MLSLLIVALWGLGADTTLGDDIVSYARSKMGQKVGNGECTSLAEEALHHCDATGPTRSGDLGRRGEASPRASARRHSSIRKRRLRQAAPGGRRCAAHRDHRSIRITPRSSRGCETGTQARAGDPPSKRGARGQRRRRDEDRARMDARDGHPARRHRQGLPAGAASTAAARAALGAGRLDAHPASHGTQSAGWPGHFAQHFLHVPARLQLRREDMPDHAVPVDQVRDPTGKHSQSPRDSVASRGPRPWCQTEARTSVQASREAAM